MDAALSEVIRHEIDADNSLSRQYRLEKLSNDRIAFPLCKPINERIFLKYGNLIKYSAEPIYFKSSKRSSTSLNIPSKRITDLISQLVSDSPKTLPLKWELYDNFLLFGENAFEGEEWKSWFANQTESCLQSFFDIFQMVFTVKNIAKKGKIAPIDIRYPNLSWIVVDGITRPWENFYVVERFEIWTKTIQNSIPYFWAPSFTMFSQGNITEKIRVAGSKFGEEETVLDLYAGIGYFTLPYLVHRKSRFVHACDMNAWSLNGLIKSLETLKIRFNYINGEKQHSNPYSKITIYEGDNSTYGNYFFQKCDRVNLGLLPSSESGWNLAVNSLKPSGGYLHIHMNIDNGKEGNFENFMMSALVNILKTSDKENLTPCILHRERVKSFGPRVYHWVFDIEIK
jgi:tRNA wybutosine-synthesizing protein 2